MDNNCGSYSKYQRRKQRIMAGAIKFMTGLMMAVLFTFAVLSYTFGYAKDNKAYADLNSDTGLVNLTKSLNTSVQDFRVKSNTSSEVFHQEASSKVSDETTDTGASFNLISSLPTMMDNILNVIQVRIFGDDESFAIFATAISSILVVIAFMYIWKIIRGGSPD
jgi:hypothetical protein